jgi:hypothetical protein
MSIKLNPIAAICARPVQESGLLIVASAAPSEPVHDFLNVGRVIATGVLRVLAKLAHEPVRILVLLARVV